MTLVAMDNQPIAAGFFGSGKWLTDYVTPEDLEVKELYNYIISGQPTLEDKLKALRRWVASEVRYKKLITGKIWVEGKSSVQRDLWMSPNMVINTKIGNCANKSFLLASLIRNMLSSSEAYCVLGNLYNGKAGGHAWVEVKMPDGSSYVMESTRLKVPDMVPVENAERYEPVHYFNDKELYAVEGKTVLEPFTMCYSTWLDSYLDWAYIEGRK